MSNSPSENKEENVRIEPYEKKYFALLSRCELIKQSNERLVSRIFNVKKLLHTVRRERRYLMDRLDYYGDDYKNIPLTLFSEDSTPSAVVDTKPDIGSLTSSLARPSNVSASIEVSLPSSHSSGKHSTSTPSSSSSSRKRSRQSEKERDPNAPKRPANPFFLYCQDQRMSVMERHQKDHKEEINHQELTKDLAKSWNSLSTEEKKVYYDLYEHEKERYEQEMKLYAGGEDLGSACEKT